jgi:hypothetical protein
MTGRELCAQAPGHAELVRRCRPGERNPEPASQLRRGLPGHGGAVIASLADHRQGASDVFVNGAADQLPVLAVASGPREHHDQAICQSDSGQTCQLRNASRLAGLAPLVSWRAAVLADAFRPVPFPARPGDTQAFQDHFWPPGQLLKQALVR